MTSIDGLTGLDTSHVTDMSNMFNGMAILTTLDVSQFNTTNVTDMSNMFNGMIRLPELDVSQFNTTNVTNMQHMFFSMSSLTTLDVSQFNTTNVTNMQYMFSSMYALTTLDVSQFNTTNVTSMQAMFYRMTALTDLDLNSFDTSRVSDTLAMLYGMTALERLTLGTKTALGLDTGLPAEHSIPSQFSSTWALIPLSTPGWTGTSTELITRSRTPSTAAGIYARLNVLTVTFDGNDSAVVDVPNPVAGTALTTVTIPMTIPTRPRHTFTGWNTASDGSGTHYAAGDPVSLSSGTHMLYAQWQEDPRGSITVQYRDAAGNILESDSTHTNYVGEPYTFTAPVISGYTFTKASPALTGTYTLAPATITLTYTAVSTPPTQPPSSTPSPSIPQLQPSTPTDVPSKGPLAPGTGDGTGADNEETLPRKT